MRHYITFVIITITLQLFIIVFNRSLAWLFNLSTKTKRFSFVVIFLITNTIILATVFRIYPMYRLSAAISIFLLYATFTAILLKWVSWLFRRNKNAQKTDRTLKLAYPVILAAIFAMSLYNAYVPKVVHYEIGIDKTLKPLRIGVASDLHLGKLFGGKQLDQLADIFNREKVDLILLPGDIMDDNLLAYRAENMQPHLAKLKAPLGVYATLGNHDFFGAQQAIAQAIKRAGIQVLWDQAVTINNEFVIVGRNDDLERSRPSTVDLLKQVNTKLPVFLMDHRPTEIELHADLPIDIQVSGHTHNGQVFPLNFIVSAIYRLSYGYEKIGNGHFFITSGYGFWGIPMRLGSQSEVFIIDVKGKNNKENMN